jgi:hypothetical protein
MRSLVDRMDPQVRIVRRYTVEPRIDGIRGWDGRSYAHGINGLKFQVRRIARIVAPWDLDLRAGPRCRRPTSRPRRRRGGQSLTGGAASLPGVASK